MVHIWANQDVEVVNHPKLILIPILEKKQNSEPSSEICFIQSTQRQDSHSIVSSLKFFEVLIQYSQFHSKDVKK